MLRLGPSPLEPGESPSPPRRKKTEHSPPPRDGYTGTRNRRIPNGLGTWTVEDGSEWRGRWLDGNKHGRGTAKYSNGTVIKGLWSRGTLQGRGDCTHDDGTTYVGEYWKGLRHGEGVLTLPSGTEYHGEFKKGRMDGTGTCKTRGGFTLIGKWEAGKVCGTGMLKCPDGFTVTRKWAPMTVAEVIRVVINERSADAASEIARMSALLRVARKYRARDLVKAARDKVADAKARRKQEEKDYYTHLQDLYITTKRRAAREARTAQYRDYGLSESESTGDECDSGDGGGGGVGGEEMDGDTVSRPGTTASSRLDTAELDRPFTASSLTGDTDFNRPFTATSLGRPPTRGGTRRRSTARRRSSLKFPRPLQKVDKRQYKAKSNAMAGAYGVGKKPHKPDVMIL